MNKRLKRTVAAIAALSIVAAACGDDDSASSAREEAFDRPLIEEACADAGIECTIQNAEGATLGVWSDTKARTPRLQRVGSAAESH